MHGAHEETHHRNQERQQLEVNQGNSPNPDRTIPNRTTTIDASSASEGKRGGADTLRNAGKMRSPVVLGRGRQDAGRGVGV